MGRTSYSPYPSVDSASDYAPEPATPVTKRRPRGSMTAEERREARAHRNRLAAQSSRDRKKAQFDGLSHRVAELEEENRSLRLLGRSSASSSSSTAADPALLKENAELRARIEQLEQAWQNITKLLGSMSIPLPGASPMPQLSSSSPSRQPFSTLLTLPLSPAATSPSLSTSNSDSIDVVTEPTCELARSVPAAGGPLVTLFDHQTVVGTKPMGTTSMYDFGNPAAIDGQWTKNDGLLTDPLSSFPTLPSLGEGYNEMERLLGLLPNPGEEQGLNLTLDPALTTLPTSTNQDDWTWLTEGVF